MTVTLKPTGDRLVIEPIEENKTPGGIVLPDTLVEQGIRKATVIAAGPGRTEAGVLIEMPCKVGDVVAYMRLPMHLEVREQKFKLIPANDVIAIIEEVIDDDIVDAEIVDE